MNTSMMYSFLMVLDGKRFQKIRERLGLSREELAELFGLSGYMAISNIENGTRNAGPTLAVVMRTLDAIPLKKAQDIIEAIKKHGRNP
ncbi:MAG: helix-turn-helix transcriptional regulator [Bdellovibrionales bacterium]|nr:helix-turn-helix transcriptional regulator [Bdellovibrionales bacterium]